MDKEMTNSSILFYVREYREFSHGECKEMKSHMIFGNNLDDGFVHKTRFVADRHKVDKPPLMMYTPVLLIYSNRIFPIL